MTRYNLPSALLPLLFTACGAVLFSCGADRETQLQNAQNLLDQQNAKAAAEIYYALVERHPEDVEAIAGLVAASRLQEATAEHARWCEELLKFRPWDREANIAVGKKLLREGNSVDAATRFILALQQSEFKLEKQEAVQLLIQAGHQPPAVLDKDTPDE